MNNSEISNLYVGSTQVKEVRKGSSLVAAPNGDALWYKANEVPSLDLRFAESKSLVDATTGSNLVDFTRASSGTYVGSDGLVKTAVTNLLLRSEEFDQSPWLKSNAAMSVTADTSTAPNGTLTADTLIKDAAGYRFFYQAFTGIAGTTYTASVRFKQGTLSKATIVVSGDGGVTSHGRVVFDLSLKTATDVTSTNLIGAGIQDLGDGWFLCYVSAVIANNTNPRVLIYPDRFDVAVAGSIVAWGAQLEQSSTVGEYVKTTSTINSAPRFDHDPATGESLGLLVEESRTNLSPYSRYENGQWTFSAASIGTSTKTAVDGETITAFLTDTSTAPHRVNRSVSGAYTAGTVVTLSFYVAKPSNSDIRGLIIRLRTAAGGQSVAVGVSDDGDNSVYTFASSSPFGASPPPAITSGSFSAVPVGNKWTRISIVTQVSSANTNYTQWDIGFSTALSSDTGTGTANSELFIDAVQLEAGSFPTSYIPTTSSTVTRVADVASISGSNFSGWFNESEGSLYTAASFIGAVSQTSFIAQAALNGANYISTYRDGSPQRLTARVVAAGVDSAFFYTTASAIQADVEYRNCVGYKLNDFAATSNGAVPAGDLAGNVPTGLTTLGLGGSPYTSSVPLNGHIRRLTYWPARLPNETLQTITQ